MVGRFPQNLEEEPLSARLRIAESHDLDANQISGALSRQPAECGRQAPLPNSRAPNRIC